MGNTLVLDVPADLYEPLAQTAAETGQTPEQLAIAWLTASLRHAADDPVEDFIGAFDSEVSDWADRHDKYLGLALLEEKQDTKTGDNQDA